MNTTLQPNTSPFELRGIIEGFYGTFYTSPERNDLIRFLGQNGFNAYVYGPKNDRQHRVRWREPYPPDILDQFAESIRIARQSGVAFCYAISFGVPVSYASPEDYEIVAEKLRAFFERGCRSFAVFLDDLSQDFVYEVDPGTHWVPFCNAGEAHADFCNRLHAWLRSLDPECSLHFCPPEYCGRAPFGEYLHDLGEALHPDVGVFYTGPEVCSVEISAADVSAFAAAVRRAPLIWDNYPVNDLGMRSELHLGPVRGRDPFLYQACRGFFANTMNEAEASKIALLTLTEYLNDPSGYEPEEAWKRALPAVAGPESYQALSRFAENSLRSVLQAEEAPKMTQLVSETLAALMRGEPARPQGTDRASSTITAPAASVAASDTSTFGEESSEAVADLARYIDQLDESCYHLKNRMRNLALRQNLLPWVEALEDKIWLGRRALAVLEELERDVDPESWGPAARSLRDRAECPALRAMLDVLENVRLNPKRIGGAALPALADYAAERATSMPRAATGGGAVSGIAAREQPAGPTAEGRP